MHLIDILHVYLSSKNILISFYTNDVYIDCWYDHD